MALLGNERTNERGGPKLLVLLDRAPAGCLNLAAFNLGGDPIKNVLDRAWNGKQSIQRHRDLIEFDPNAIHTRKLLQPPLDHCFRVLRWETRADELEDHLALWNIQ
ncbi:MAG: hypothetical protein NVSMB68_10920 [Thermoanaerobaculia bacterium]